MNKKNIVIFSIFVVVMLVLGVTFSLNGLDSKDMKTYSVSGTVTRCDDNTVMVQGTDSVIYTFDIEGASFDIGDAVVIEYATSERNFDVISYKVVDKEVNEDGIPITWMDDGIFSDYYKQAYDKLQTLTLDEKIGQLLLIRYPSSDQLDVLKKYKPSGFVFYEKDFKDKTLEEVKSMISSLQDNAKIPLLTAVDEEGGNVVRVSSNPNLVTEKFKSSSELYNSGGFELIKEDTINKSKILYNLGLNLNLAPVVDVSTNESDYMYERTLKQGTDLTSTYAKTVIEASKNTGVSYTLKHFPGYGSNADTHLGTSFDDRSYEEIVENDLPPFKVGIEAKAEAVLVSHNIVNSIDSSNPASLSIDIHNLLRSDLAFTGIVMTDDISMGATSNIENAAVQALLAGNDLIITTDYEDSFEDIKNAVNDGALSEESIDRAAFRVLSWKYYKLLLVQNDK